MNYGKNLLRKGELVKIKAMEKLAKKIERESRENLAAAFLTEAYYGFDCFAIIANDSRYQNKTGYVLFDEDKQKAVFIPDDEE